MNTPIPEIEYSDFSQGLSQGQARLMQEATIELTYRCNLNCCHCYCNIGELKREEEELSFKEVCAIIDQAREQGCFWLAFTGGEPLARKDFFELYLYAKKKGFLIAVLTNATLIDEKAVEFFEQWPPRQIEISLYGICEETYERVTGVKGSFKKCMRALCLLSKRGINLEIKAMALTLNKHEIKQIKDFALSLGARFRYDHLVHCALTGDKSPHKYRLSPEESVDLDLELEDMAKGWEKDCRSYQGTVIDPDRLFICGAGKSSIYVNPYGNLQACSFPISYKYDLKKGPLIEGWNNFSQEVTEKKRLKAGYPCHSCKVHALCSQCPAWAFLECADEEGVVGYICALFKERARRFGTEYLERDSAQERRVKSNPD